MIAEYIVKTPVFYSSGIRNYLAKNKIKDKEPEGTKTTHFLRGLDVVVDLPTVTKISINLKGRTEGFENNEEFIEMLKWAEGGLTSAVKN